MFPTSSLLSVDELGVGGRGVSERGIAEAVKSLSIYCCRIFA